MKNLNAPRKALSNLNEILAETKGFPTRKDEQWKYTSVASITGKNWVRAPKLSLKDAEPYFQNSRLLVNPAAELVFVNGEYVPEFSTKSNVEGLFVGSLETALQSEDEKLKKALGSAAAVFQNAEHRGDENTFATINNSLFADAAVVYAAPNVVAKAPIILTFISTSSQGADLSVSEPRVFAVFGAHSEASVVENHTGSEEIYFSNNLTDGILEEGARVSYVKLQKEGQKSAHIGTSRFSLGRAARLENLQVSLGAQLSRQDLKIRLLQSGAEAVVDGLYITRNKQHIDNHTSIEHVVGETLSEQLYKGILDDESRAVFNGRIFIAQDAQKANSSQLNNNLLLSKKAEIDTKPELEIFADDVKAGHGATIGRLDPEHLFYLKSRAISEKDAVAMLALGFANDLVLRRSNPFIRDALRASVADAVSGLKVGV